MRIYPLSFSPRGRAERLEIAQWAILAMEPACRGDTFPTWGKVGKGVKIKEIVKRFMVL